jgi:hypothetical protein
LAPFKRVAHASDEKFDVYQAAHDRGSTRIWISRQDGLIHRSRFLGYPGGSVDVSEMRLNTQLHDADLVYELPGDALAGLWIDEHPAAFYWILVAMAAAIGWLFWFVVARRSSSEQRWRDIRRGGWKLFGVIAALLLVLAVTNFCSRAPSRSGILDIQRGFALVQLLVIVTAFFAASGLVRYRGKLPAGGNP